MRRGLCALLALMLAAPALGFPQAIQPRGSAGGAPVLGNLSGAMTAGAAAGTSVILPTISGLPGCAWSIAPATYFSQNASTGQVSTTSTATTAGTYAPTTSCTLTSGGQTVAISASLSIVANAGAGAAAGSLDFSAPAQSGLLTVL